MFWRKPSKRTLQNPPFRTVHFSLTGVEYSGSLVPTPGVRHNLLCSPIKRTIAEALLGQGFKPIEGRIPTHSFFCTFALNKDAGALRCLFNLYLGLEEYPQSAQDYIALQVTRGLKRSLLARRSPEFLIRCKSETEFPWCIDDSLIDEFWLVEAGVYLRSAISDLKGD